MSRIRGKNTTPELFLRRALFERGFRFRLHDRKLPGTPDLVFRKYNAVIFVHGCFWHGHDCPYFRWPALAPTSGARRLRATVRCMLRPWRSCGQRAGAC